MVISDDEIKELEEIEKEINELDAKATPLIQEIGKIQREADALRKKCREKFGLAPGDPATLSNQVKLIRKAVSESEKETPKEE